jgi:hypothetical protein
VQVHYRDILSCFCSDLVVRISVVKTLSKLLLFVEVRIYVVTSNCIPPSNYSTDESDLRRIMKLLYSYVRAG